MNQLENKIAVITGATSGIGRAAALLFAREGATVVLAGRRADLGQALAQEIQAQGGNALFVQTDVADDVQIDHLFGQTLATFGRIDVLFNNAGVEGVFGQGSHEITPENFDQIFAVNVRGFLRVHQAAARQMLAQGTGGSIVNTSSIAGQLGFPGAAAYAASKFAVEGFTKSSALELAPAGIRVNAVAPGAIETEMAERALSGFKDQVIAMHPLGRMGKPEEVAEAALFLASDRASFITGHSLNVDGGFAAA